MESKAVFIVIQVTKSGDAPALQTWNSAKLSTPIGKFAFLLIAEIYLQKTTGSWAKSRLSQT